jgi:F0F1-type ATP synthase membrane subunit b/b'
MGNGVQELLDMLYSMITDAWGLPLGAEKCVIERDKALNLLDEIKSLLPQELAEAQRLVSARTEFIANAKREADSIRKAAEERAKQLVDEQEIYRIAKGKSNDLMTTAETKSAELRRVANNYADDALRRTEEAIHEALEEVRQSRVRFRNAATSVRAEKAIPTIDMEMDEEDE